MRRFVLAAIGGLLIVGASHGDAFAAKPRAAATKGGPSTEEVLAQGAESGKFTFIVFHKEDSSLTRVMRQIVEEGVASRSNAAQIAYVDVADPANLPLIERYSLQRTPMPLTLCVAPNGATTGFFSKEISDEALDSAIVSPTMMVCMKALQQNKLVFVCVRTSQKSPAPPCIKQLQNDPDFKDRLAVVAMQVDDPNEDRLRAQMKIEASEVEGSVAIMLAPPGLLIGKYDASATADEVIIALNKAGKCCDDPNCKHNKGSTSSPQAKKPAATKGTTR